MSVFFAALSWEWSKIIQSIASISMVWIAYKALTTWKQKSTADNKISFIGELSDEIHNFIVVISPLSYCHVSKAHEFWQSSYLMKL
jgi:hypothetical protein